MRAAIYQCDLAGCAARDRVDRLHAAAEQARADLLLCPELFMSGYNIGDNIVQCAEPSDGPFARDVARIAQATGTAITYGYPERADDTVFNAAQCIDATGTRLANHRKTVLPPGFEPGQFTGGGNLTLFDLGGITFGLLICYEVEFPEAVRACAQAGAQAVLVPTALGKPWPVVAHQVVPTRAFENGVFVLYANHAGAEGDIDYLGASCIIDPRGNDLTRAGGSEEIITADLDPASVTAAQARLPYLTDLSKLPRAIGST